MAHEQIGNEIHAVRVGRDGRTVMALVDMEITRNGITKQKKLWRVVKKYQGKNKRKATERAERLARSLKKDPKRVRKNFGR